MGETAFLPIKNCSTGRKKNERAIGKKAYIQLAAQATIVGARVWVEKHAADKRAPTPLNMVHKRARRLIVIDLDVLDFQQSFHLEHWFSNY